MMSSSRGGHHLVLTKKWQGAPIARTHTGINNCLKGITCYVARGTSCRSYQGDQQLLPSDGHLGQALGHGEIARAPGVPLFASYRIQGFGTVEAAPAHDASLWPFGRMREEQTKLQQLDAEPTTIAPQQRQPEQPPPELAPPEQLQQQQQHELRAQQQNNKDSIWRKRATDEAAHRLKLEEKVAFMKGENTALKSEIAALRDMVQATARQQPGGGAHTDSSVDILTTMLAAVSVAIGTQQQGSSSSIDECSLASRPKLEVVELLQQAIQTGDMVRVKQLLVSGARPDVNIPKYAASPLHLAAKLGATQICRVLLLSGADPDARARMGGATPLHLAVQHGTEDTVRCLLLAEANVNAEDNDGNTPLHLAVNRGEWSIMDLLLTAGANKDAINKAQETPYDVAINPNRRRLMLRKLRHYRRRQP